LRKKHQHEARELIKADLCAMLAELASLPERVTDASWLERVAEEQEAGAEPVAKARERESAKELRQASPRRGRPGRRE
jgi:hypothetical protein